jgi:hypothetical protein
LKALPLRFPLLIALRKIDIVNRTLVAKFTIESRVGVYKRESLYFQHSTTLRESLFNQTYDYHFVVPTEPMNLPMWAFPVAFAALVFVLGASGLLWIIFKMRNVPSTIQIIVTMLVVALLLNLIYVIVSLGETSVTTCSVRHVSSSLIVAAVQR